MSYCDLDDIKLRKSDKVLEELTQDDSASGEINSDRVDAAIADADLLIDTYIGGVYTLPLADTPVLINKLSVDISIYNLYNIRYDNELPKQVKDSYDEALDLLGKIRDCAIELSDCELRHNYEDLILTNIHWRDRIFSTRKFRKIL